MHEFFQRFIHRKDGVRGLYRGMTSPLLGVAGINAVTFGVNAQVNLFRSDTLLTKKAFMPFLVRFLSSFHSQTASRQ